MVKSLSYIGVLAVGVCIGYFLKPQLAPQIELVPVEKLAESQQKTSPNLNEILEKAEPVPSPGKDVTEQNFSLKEEFETSMNAEDFDKASATLRRMEVQSPQSKDFLDSQSRFLVRTRKWEEAKVALKECLTYFPKSTSCLIDMLSTELQIGTKEEQSNAAAACVLEMPKDPQCLNMLAITKMNQGKYSEAVVIYQQLKNQNGSYGFRFSVSMLDWQLGLALEGAGRRQEAADSFYLACKKDYAQACEKYEELRQK